MAHTKAKGSTKLGRDSRPKYLGVKLQDGQAVIVGNIIVRQRGSRYISGLGVKKGTDDTLFSLKNGTIRFTTKRKKNYDGRSKVIKIVSVV